MKRIYALIAISILTVSSVFAATIDDSLPEPPKPKKFEFKIGGRVDVNVFLDTHKAEESCGGLQWLYPNAPVYNPQGQDMNQVNSLRFSASGSRFNFGLKINDILHGATGYGLIEADFLGINPSTLGLLRLRHAYFSLNWKRQGILLGQTSHLTMPDEMAANNVTFGGGYPFNPLSRPVQVQFTQRWGRGIGNVTIAAGMFGGQTGLTQSQALTPEIALRFMVGKAEKTMFGAVIAFKSVKPRSFTADSSRSSVTVNSLSTTIFMRHKFLGGHTIRLFALWGQDQAPISMIGTYAPLLGDITQNVQDYRYAPIGVLSVWADYDSKIYKRSKLQYGLFIGYQQNLGTTQEVYILDQNLKNPTVENFLSIAPRLWFHPIKNLSFAIEYMYSEAIWAKTRNTHYRPSELYNPTANHKIQFLARYKF